MTWNQMADAFLDADSAGSTWKHLEAGWEAPAERDPFGRDGRPTERVQPLLQALPERERAVLTCRFLLGLSTRETAVRLGLTEGNVKTVQHRALKRAATLDAG